MLAALEFLALRRLRDLVRESRLREQAERELEGKEEYFRALIENSSDGICVLRNDGTILYAAPSVERLLGRKTESLVGKSFLEHVSIDDTVNTAAVLSRLMDNPGSTATFEARVKHQSGEWRTIEAVAQNLVNDVLGSDMVVNFRDVTERKEAEERKWSMEQQVQLAGRLAALGEITAGVAHELSNPLAAVQLYAQYLASKKNLDETIKRDLEKVYAESQRATKISENLLSFARRHEPDRRLISLNEVIEKSVELHMYRLRVNNIHLWIELDPELPRIMADFHQMQQVVVNMVTNAEQAITGARGVGSLSIKTQNGGGTVQMSFADDGPGIDAVHLSKIFEPFFTTKGDGKGTGLGLSICRRIVEQHGGRLLASSEVGKGTTFTVELPVTSDDPAPAGRTESDRVGQA
jgi:two-component system NtrC family sensor kinase